MTDKHVLKTNKEKKYKAKQSAALREVWPGAASQNEMKRFPGCE